ncbi:MAG: hypothetical protein AAF800_13165 [Planctomycetota bacterium]
MTRFSSSQYDVQKPSGFCQATGDSLEPGTGCYSALVDIPPEQREPSDRLGMKRVDVSIPAWDRGYRPPHLYSFWRTTVPEPNAKKKTFVDDAVLLNLLRRLEDAAEPPRLAFRYVVALILMRKKLLRYDGSETREGPGDEGQEAEWWLFTPKADVSKGHFGKWSEGETIAVLDPKLDAEQIEGVTTQLGEILEAEL